MNKSFSAKVLILLLVVVLGGTAIFFQKGGQKKSLTSDVLAPVVTPATCDLQSDIDKIIADKNSLSDIEKETPTEILSIISQIDTTVLENDKLITQKKEIDSLGTQTMNPEKPSDLAYKQAKTKFDNMVKPVVPAEPTIPVVPLVPEKPTLAAAPVVPRKPTAPTPPKAPAIPKTGTAAYQNYIKVLKPRYDAAKNKYDTELKPNYDIAKEAYDTAVAAKKIYDTVTKPAYTKALAEYNAAVSAKKKYDTITKPAYDKAKKAYDDAVAAKKVYDAAFEEYTRLYEQYSQQLEQYNAFVAYASAVNTYVISVSSVLDDMIQSMKQNVCPAQENQCANKIDDDRDGIQDCDDSDCSEDNACKKDVVSCTVGSGDKQLFRFEHSNGSTDFTGQTFSMGTTDPYIMMYEMSYEQNKATLRTDIYLDGEKLDCPVIVREMANPSDEPLPTCEELRAELQNEDAQGIQCTGQYSFIARFESNERPEKSGLFSNFLASSSLFGEDENNESTNTCDTVNCYECASNQTKDSNGNCVDVGCPYGQEEVNGSCVDSCLSPQIRDSSGSCVDPGCPSGQEEWNGTCVSVCASDETRNSASGSCEKSGCPYGQEEVNGTCMDPCIAPQTRQSDGTCSSGGYCGNGTVDEGEECDGGSDCDSSCKKTTNPYCGNGTTESGEECDDGNTADGDGCSAGCTNESGSCGDGTVDEGEECDDGNTSDSDGCDASCKNECSDNSGLGSSFFGLNLKWLKSDATSGQSCKKCDNGLPATYQPDCKCPKGHKIKNGECVKTFWQKFKDGFKLDISPFGEEKYYGFSSGWDF